MHHCGGKLRSKVSAQQHSPKAGLHGSLELPGLDSKLDMQLPGVKLFALELAALQGSAQQLLAKLKAQPAEDLDKVIDAGLCSSCLGEALCCPSAVGSSLQQAGV